MTGFPKIAASVTPQYIHTATPWSVGASIKFLNTATYAATTWVNGLGIYIPFTLPFEYTVRRMLWINGSTITSTSVDAGIYTFDGTRLYSTTPTVASGASSVQAVTLGTPLTLSPDHYYMCWTCNNTTSRGWAAALSAANGRQIGLLQQSSIATLPATATFASYAGQGVPMVGFSRLP